MSLIIPPTQRRLVTRALRCVRRCPQGCDGDLKVSAWLEGEKTSYQYSPLMVTYRCEVCGLRFLVTNPRSFAPISNEAPEYYI